MACKRSGVQIPLAPRETAGQSRFTRDVVDQPVWLLQPMEHPADLGWDRLEVATTCCGGSVRPADSAASDSKLGFVIGERRLKSLAAGFRMPPARPGDF